MGFLREIQVLKDGIRTNVSRGDKFQDVRVFIGNGKVLGGYGDVIFEVSSLKVETLMELKRKMKGRYATHEVVGQKSRLEYVGMEPDEITFKMQLHAGLGVNVEAEMEKMMKKLRSGESNYLIFGQHAYGQYKWVLTDLNIDYEYEDRNGAPYYVTMELTLREVLLE